MSGLVVFLTGGTGYVGSAILEGLLAEEVVAEVRVLSRSGLHLPSSHSGIMSRAGHKVVSVRGEICGAVDLRGVNVVVHAAALRNQERCRSQPGEAMIVNVQGTENLARAAARDGVDRFVYLSSQAVYGECEGLVSEDCPSVPHGPYGETKLLGEKAVEAVASRFGSYAVLRLARVYGNRPSLEKEEGVFRSFGCSVLTRRPLRIINPVRHLSIVHAWDVSRFLSLAAGIPGSFQGVYNIGGSQPVTVGDLAQAFRAAAATIGLGDPGIECLDAGNGGNGWWLDNARIQRVFGWKEEVPLGEGVLEQLRMWAGSPA